MMIWLSAKDRQLLSDLEQEISITNLKETWKQLIDFAPMPSGSPQETQAILFLKEKLEKYGIPHQLLWYDGYLSEPKEAQLTILTPKEQVISCAPYRQVVSTPEEGIQGELIYIPPKNIGKINVRDKIILCEQLNFKETQELQKMGVKGVIAISNDTFAPDIIHQRADFSVSGNPTLANYDQIPKFPAIAISHNDGQLMKKLCIQNTTRVHFKSIVETSWKKLPLLSVEIRGAKTPDKFILVNGHIDTPPFSPGVTDNTSGDVLIIELARVFHKFKDQLDRSIRFLIWTGHEIGRYAGSTWYNDAFWHDLRYNCITCINIDSPGAEGATTYGPLYVSETYELQQESIRKATGETIERILWPARDGDSSFWGTGLANSGLFSERPEEMANPNVNYSGLGWWWHTPWATFDRGDPEILLRDGKANINFIFHLCNCPILPMDFMRYTEEMIRILNDLQAQSDKIRAYFSLNPVIERIKEFKEYVKKLETFVEETITQYEITSNKAAFNPIFKEINSCYMWISRHVNQVAHSDSTKTEQMSMEHFGLKAFPRLQPILDLVQMPLPDHPTFKFLVTDLIRQRNFVVDGFYLAIKEIQDTLDTVKSMPRV